MLHCLHYFSAASNLYSRAVPMGSSGRGQGMRTQESEESKEHQCGSTVGWRSQGWRAVPHTRVVVNTQTGRSEYQEATESSRHAGGASYYDIEQQNQIESPAFVEQNNPHMLVEQNNDRSDSEHSFN